jgi:hypothetical protein
MARPSLAPTAPGLMFVTALVGGDHCLIQLSDGGTVPGCLTR